MFSISDPGYELKKRLAKMISRIEIRLSDFKDMSTHLRLFYT